MSYNKTIICQSALIKLGEELILSTEDGTKATELCDARYTFCRDLVIGEVKPRIARARQVLGANGNTPAFEYEAEFNLPTDYLAMRKVCDEGGYEIERDEYELEGTTILANESTLYLKYIKRITNIAFIDDDTAEAMALYLAYDISDAITQSDTKLARLQERYMIAKREAKSRNSREQPTRQVNATGLLSARNGSRRRRGRFPPEAY